MQLINLNLTVAVVAIVLSFFMANYLLDVEDASLSNRRASHMMQYVKTSGVRLLTIPSSRGGHTIPAAEPFGAAEAVHKVMRFFTRNIRSPSLVKENNDSLFCGESTIVKSVLRRASRTSKDGVARILHLCSATSCVAPYLTQYHSEVVRKTSGESITVYAFIYGDAVLGHGIERDLAYLGVVTPVYGSRATEESAMPLYGHTADDLTNINAKCTLQYNSCEYGARGNDTTLFAPVPVIPLDKVSLGKLPLPSTQFDVVHIDLNSDNTLAGVTYLRGLLSLSSHPTHIFLTVYPSLFSDELAHLVTAIREKVGYNVLLLGGRCSYASENSLVFSGTTLGELLRRESPTIFSKVNLHSYSAESLCSFLLSGVFSNLKQLFDETGYIKQEKALEDFIFDVSTNVNRSIRRNEVSGMGVVLRSVLLVVPIVIAGVLVLSLFRARLRSRHP